MRDGAEYAFLAVAILELVIICICHVYIERSKTANIRAMKVIRRLRKQTETEGV